MRIVLGSVIVIAVVAGVLTHNQREKSDAQPTKSAVATPAPREVSQHDWAKHALDRAAEVKKQVAAQRKANAAEE